MQYEKPNMEIVSLENMDVITLSVGVGDGENVEGGWN